MRLSIRSKAYASLLGVALIWGAGSVVVKATLAFLPPITFLFLRFLLVLPILLPWCVYYLKKHKIRKKDIVPLMLLSLMAPTLHLTLVYTGINKTTAIDANLIGVTAPIFISIWGVLFLKERFTLRKVMGLAIAVTGTIITVIQPLLAGDAFARSHLEGNIIMFSSTILWSSFVLLSKVTSSKFPPLLITLVGGVLALPVYGIGSYIELGYTLPHIGTIVSKPPVLAGLLFTAYIAYALSYWLYEYGIGKIDISDAAQFTYLQPLIATPLAVLWLGETISLAFVFGAGLIFAGVVLSEWK